MNPQKKSIKPLDLAHEERDPFADPFASNHDSFQPPVSAAPGGSENLYPRPMDALSIARRGRSRQWDREHRATTYRGIPPELHQEIVETATSLHVPVDELAHYFLQYGAECFQNGTLVLEMRPSPTRARRTLFPLEKGWTDYHGWTVKGWNPSLAAEDSAHRGKGKKARREPLSYGQRVAYRISRELHQYIADVAREKSITIGEMASVFLKHSLECFKTGTLEVQVYSKESNTLYNPGEGQG